MDQYVFLSSELGIPVWNADEVVESNRIDYRNV